MLSYLSILVIITDGTLISPVGVILATFYRKWLGGWIMPPKSQSLTRHWDSELGMLHPHPCATSWEGSGKIGLLGISLVVQWLRLHTSSVRGAGSIPGWGPRFHMPCGMAKKKKKPTTINPRLSQRHPSKAYPLCKVQHALGTWCAHTLSLTWTLSSW